jgi:glycosyltransferase involved in cell wall biosynthesis
MADMGLESSSSNREVREGEPRTGTGRRLRILFVTPFGPRFDSKHGGRVIAQLLHRMVDRHEIGIVYQRLPHSAPIDPALAARCALVREIRFVPQSRFGAGWQHQKRVLEAVPRGRPTPVGAIYSREFAEAVRDSADAFAPSIIQIEHDALGYCIPAADRPHSSVVIVCHDPGLNASRDLVRVTTGRRRLSHRLDVIAWGRYWARTLSRADAVITFTAQDAASIREAAPDAQVVPIPLGIDVPARAAEPAGHPPPRILFIGGYLHPPNADAALRLMRSIMPRVRREHPGLRLILVGDQPTATMRAAAGDYDVITGAVPSVAPFVEAAALIAVPIRLGGGMRVKLLEALAAGKAVVATPLAAAGLDVTDGEQLRLADSDEDFARAILELLADDRGRARLGVSARDWAQDNLGWGLRIRRYEALYDRLADVGRL